MSLERAKNVLIITDKNAHVLALKLLGLTICVADAIKQAISDTKLFKKKKNNYTLLVRINNIFIVCNYF